MLETTPHKHKTVKNMVWGSQGACFTELTYDNSKRLTLHLVHFVHKETEA